MKKLGLGTLFGIILGGLLTGYTLIRTPRADSSDTGYTIRIFGHDFELL